MQGSVQGSVQRWAQGWAQEWVQEWEPASEEAWEGELHQLSQRNGEREEEEWRQAGTGEGGWTKFRSDGMEQVPPVPSIGACNPSTEVEDEPE